MTGLRWRLAEVRKRRKLSQEALAQIAGLRIGTVRSLEAGTARAVRFTTLVRICDVLHCQPGELFEVALDPHVFPVLGGPDEDEVLRVRQREAEPLVDGPAALSDLWALQNEPETVG